MFKHIHSLFISLCKWWITPEFHQSNIIYPEAISNITILQHCCGFGFCLNVGKNALKKYPHFNCTLNFYPHLGNVVPFLKGVIGYFWYILCHKICTITFKPHQMFCIHQYTHMYHLLFSVVTVTVTIGKYLK